MDAGADGQADGEAGSDGAGGSRFGIGPVTPYEVEKAVEFLRAPLIVAREYGESRVTVVPPGEIAALGALVAPAGSTGPAKLRCYIAGPMSGLRDFNREAFEEGVIWARSVGYEPVSPWALVRPDHPGECPSGEAYLHRGLSHPYACWFRAALKLLVTCDCIMMLPGWRRSVGAKLEWEAAEKMGMQTYYWTVTGIELDKIKDENKESEDG